MKGELRVPDYLGHIRDAIDRIFEYIDGIDETAFLENRLVQDAVIRNFEVIGEASRNIERADPHFVSQHSEIEFGSARAMRNALTHGYHKINFERVWKTIEDDLPNLYEHIVDALRKFQPGTSQ